MLSLRSEADAAGLGTQSFKNNLYRNSLMTDFAFLQHIDAVNEISPPVVKLSRLIKTNSHDFFNASGWIYSVNVVSIVGFMRLLDTSFSYSNECIRFYCILCVVCECTERSSTETIAAVSSGPSCGQWRSELHIFSFEGLIWVALLCVVCECTERSFYRNNSGGQRWSVAVSSG